MNKIAVFIDEYGEVSTFTESKSVRMYEQKDEWVIAKEIEFNIGTDIERAMGNIRKIYIDIISKLDDCKIVVVKEAQGIAYSVFYALDFSIWELEGNPLKFLEAIIKREKDYEIEQKIEENKTIVQLVKEGYYYLDLEKLQLTKPEITSKKALIPFMKNNKFDMLEVHCCHIPPWLEAEKNEGKIKMDIKKISNKDISLFISKVGD